MQYPLISEYVKAIQDAGNNLDKLAHLTPVLDNHGEPYRSSGAFAVVFKMRDERTGRCYALKCFTEEQEGRADAYRQIADELDMVDSSYITPVKYLEKELFVDSQCPDEEFPVLLMDWVDGETMEAYIASNSHNQQAMSMLCYRFCKMATWLHSQPFAHGDIKPDNIIIRTDGSLALVDYDGMFVPSMKGCKSPTIGTKDFCHHLRTVNDFDETIDDFSLASIALSLKAISMVPALLDTYGASDRLLFSEGDYRNPASSQVISALQPLMHDQDFCTLYSLFLLALARKDLSSCSFRLLIGEKPTLPPVIEEVSTKATEEELKEAFVDERGVKYSKDGRKLLKANGLCGTYSIREGTKIICDEAFSWCSSLAEVVIPNSVACINGNSFRHWHGKLKCLSPNFIYEDNVLFNKDKSRIISFRNQELKLYVIPNSVTSIGDSAFSNCNSLAKVVIPNSVTSIENSVFSWCKSLAEVIIPNSVTSIGDSAFYGCKSLAKVVIPNSVTSIGNSAFSWCKSLAEVIIPNSVTSIGNTLFWGCESLAEVVIPNSVTSIGNSAFAGCESLAEVVIPNSVTSIGNSAFAGCESLAEVVIPNSVTSIGDSAFFACKSLTEVVIPNSVVCINGNPFCDWHGKLKCLTPNFIYEDKVLFNKDKSRIVSFRNQELKSYVISNSVTSIGDSAFSNCNSLAKVVIPNCVTGIGNSAFSRCKSLAEVIIPNSVTSIGNRAFAGCESLTEVVIPNSVTSIGDSAFSDCNFPNNLKQELASRYGRKIFWL